jgi:hypothetical protein
VKSDASTVDAYLAELDDDRREIVDTVRDVILENLPDGYEEGMEYGMISYFIPLADHPGTYNGQPLSVAALASQKSHLSLYLNCVYADDGEAERFQAEWRETGKKLDMGKSCVRFKKLDDVPLEVVGRAIARTSPADFIAIYERSRAGRTK